MPVPIKTPVWKGNKDLIEQPGSPDWQFDVIGTRILRRYEGPYAKIKAEIDAGRIARGAVMADLGDGYVNYPIKSFRFVATGEGDVGRLTITLDNYSAGAGTVGTNRGESTYEEDWQVLEKPIESHPRYASLLDSALDTIREAIENNESLPASSGEGAALAEELYKKLLRGQTSYTLYNPVIRITTPYSAKPPKGEAGNLVEAPKDAPSGWKWRRTAYRRVRPGQNSDWDLVEEITGADEWDLEIYGNQN